MNIARLTAAAAGALLLLSACGGGSSSSSSDAPSESPAVVASGAAGATDMSAYRQCMSDNGVSLPEFAGRPGGGAGAPSGLPSGMPTDLPSGMPTGTPPSGGPGGGGFPGGGLPEGVDQETFDAAQAACGSLAPQGGFGKRGPGGAAAIDETAVAAYRSCLTDHDVTIADGDDWMRSLDRSDPAVESAIETCSPLLPMPTASATP